MERAADREMAAEQSRGEKRVDIVYMFTDQPQPHRFTTMFVCHHQGYKTWDRTTQRLPQHLDFRIKFSVVLFSFAVEKI